MIGHGGVFHLNTEKIVIKPIDHTYRLKQLDLFNKTFNKSFTVQKWVHKHFENPYVGASENIGMFKGDDLIAFNMFMPQEYFVDGKKKLFLQSCESVVDVEHRGHGYLGKILLNAEKILSEHYDVIYGIPNSKSKKTFEKIGYKTKYNFDEMRMLGNSMALLKEVVLRILLRLTKHSLSLNEKKIIEAQMSSSGPVEFLDVLPESCQSCNDYGIRINNNRDFYEWKINKSLDRDSVIKYLCVRSEGKIKAFCVVSFSAPSGSCRAEILDIVCCKDEYEPIGQIITELKKRCSMIKFITPEFGRIKSFLMKEGFKIHCKNIFSLMYKVINEKAEDMEEKLGESDSWEFHFIEADTILN